MSESAAPGTPSAPPSSATPPAARARSRAAIDTTPPFFEEGEVSVSTTRIVAYGAPAPLSGAKSVSLVIDKRHLRFVITLLIAAIAFGIYGAVNRNSPACAMGVMLAVVSYLAYRFQNLRHRLYVTREAGAQAEVFASGDLAFTQRVQAALEQAIAQGGQPAPTPAAE